MYERLGDGVRSAFKLAHKIARALGSESLTSDCLLLGMVQVSDDSVPARVLKEAGIWDGLIDRVHALGILPKEFGVPFSQSEDARQTCEAAEAHAIELDQHFVRLEHLFLGLIGRSSFLREECERKGVSPDRLRRDVCKLLGIDVNTDRDYHDHRLRIEAILAEVLDDKTSVQKIFSYLKGELPPN